MDHIKLNDVSTSEELIRSKYLREAVIKGLSALRFIQGLPPRERMKLRTGPLCTIDRRTIRRLWSPPLV